MNFCACSQKRVLSANGPLQSLALSIHVYLPISTSTCESHAMYMPVSCPILLASTLPAASLRCANLFYFPPNRSVRVPTLNQIPERSSSSHGGVVFRRAFVGRLERQLTSTSRTVTPPMVATYDLEGESKVYELKRKPERGERTGCCRRWVSVRSNLEISHADGRRRGSLGFVLCGFCAGASLSLSGFSRTLTAPVSVPEALTQSIYKSLLPTTVHQQTNDNSWNVPEKQITAFYIKPDTVPLVNY